MAAQLPDLRKSFELPDVGASIGDRVTRAAMTIAHGLLTDRRGERYLERPQPTEFERVAYRTPDGWRCALTRYPAAPGTPGEPILLATGLALNPLSVDYKPDVSLVRHLQKSGFDVFVFGHRADALAGPPTTPTPFDVDTLVEDDLSIAVDRVLDLTGFDRVGWIGFGFGGVLLYHHLARVGDPDRFFGAVTVGTPARFEASRSVARQARWLSRLLPDTVELPTEWALRWLSPGASAETNSDARSWAQTTEGPRLRGLMRHGVTDLHGGVAKQLARWVASGHIADRTGAIDSLTALTGTKFPLLTIGADGDSVAPPSTVWAISEYWDQEALETLELDTSWGHVDMLAAERAPNEVFEPVIDFLDRHRTKAW